MRLYAIFRSVRNILALLFCLIAAVASAQSPALTGVVRDQSGGVVSGAAVLVRSTAGVERQTTTGPDGRFTLDVPSSGDTTLIVRAGGFAEFQRKLSFQHSGIRSLEFT